VEDIMYEFQKARANFLDLSPMVSEVENEGPPKKYRKYRTNEKILERGGHGRDWSVCMF
jgi:hypothetical protein